MTRVNSKLLFLCALLAGVLCAQTDRATLRGTVTDPSNAVVPNATVTIDDLGTNIEARRLTTDVNGNYEAPGLTPGRYRVKVTSAGFRTYVLDDVLLDAGQVRRLDIGLNVGAAAETVTVQAGAAVIQTDTGAISGELDKSKFLDRPLVDVYPSPLALMTTMPGIQGNGWNLVMAGVTDRNKQSWQMDGVANDTAGDQNDNPVFFETVQVNQVGNGADASRATSFNMISKRGSNDWHASAYYKHENAGLNAAEFFNNAAGRKKAPYILHEMDADVTGPIIKNRTFFFVAWFHQKIPLGSFTLRTTASLPMRTGNFSEFSTAIKDPFNNNTPFPGNIIPASRFSSVSQKVMDLYIPKPNTGDGSRLTSNNYGWYFPYNSDLYKGDWPYFRIDHKLTDKNTLFVRWMARQTPYIRPGSGFEWATYTQKRDHRQLVASDTHVFSPTLINTFSFGHQTDNFLYGEDEQGNKPLYGNDVLKAIGLQGTNPKGYNAQGFPDMTINGISTLTNSTGAIGNLNADDGVNSYLDTMTWNAGKHVVKFGGEYRRYWYFSGSLSNQTYGTFTFNGNITGVGFADFLLGVPFTSNRLDPLVNRPNHTSQSGLFISDTFKITPKLTLDYGLRWDYYGTAAYDDNLMYNYDPASNSIIVPQGTLSKVHPLYPKNIPIKEGRVIPNNVWTNFRPRVSAAYRVTNKMVIRGGYGEYTDSWSYTARRPGSNPFVLTETYNNVITNSQPAFMFPNPFPSSLASAAVPSQTATVIPLDPKYGRIRQFNVTVEREIMNIGVRLSYIGMRNSDLAYGTYNMDKPQPSTATFAQSMRPYPLFTAVNVFGQDGKVRYNSVQAEIQKRIGTFMFNSNFTWSKNMYNFANTENPYAITDKWARDANNREKYWVNSMTWQLPVGRQQRFLSTIPRIADLAIGGWTTQFISTFASPTYVSPNFSGGSLPDPSGTNTSGGLPDAIADPYSGSGYTRTIDKWFNSAAYAVPRRGTFGNASPNSIEGYGINVQHLSVAKTFSITERFRATFTGAFSNLFNHPHFQSINTNILNPDPGRFTSTRPNYEPEKQSYRQVDMKLRLEW